MRTILTAAVLLASTFAACLADPASVDTSSLPAELPLSDLAGILVENLTLERPDGATLVLTVFRPPTDEPVPVLVDIGPYYHSGTKTYMLSGFDKRLAEYFLPHGYAVARAAVRGTGDSTGCFDVGGFKEQEDAAAIVDFLGEQPWSNGNVAAIGKSYDGTTPWEAAIMKPKHLKAIVPISGITDMYRYMFYNGTVLYPWGAHFLMYYAADEDYGVDPLFGLGAFGLLDGEDQAEYAQAWIDSTYDEGSTTPNPATECAAYPDLLLNQYRTDLLGTHDAFWDERDYASRFGDIEAAVFLVHGWQDWNVKPDHIARVWEKIQSPKIAWIGQWYHDYPDVNRLSKDWERHDWNATLLAFFDQTLKGVDTGIFDRPPVETQDQLGTWRKEATFPPTGDVRTLHLGDGTLEPESTSAGAIRFRGDPTRRPGPDAGDGSVAFVSEPLDAPVRVAGIPQVDLVLTPLQAGGHVAVTLYNVTGDTWTPLDTGFLDLRHAASRDEARPVTPGEAMTVRVEMFPQDLVFEAGQRIGLVVSGEWPADPANGPFFFFEGWASPWPIYPWPGPAAYELDRESSALRLPVAPV